MHKQGYQKRGGICHKINYFVVTEHVNSHQFVSVVWYDSPRNVEEAKKETSRFGKLR
jgi:hypothetical protein